MSYFEMFPFPCNSFIKNMRPFTILYLIELKNNHANLITHGHSFLPLTAGSFEVVHFICLSVHPVLF